jgi:ABC-type transport system substrate-binding protein
LRRGSVRCDDERTLELRRPCLLLSALLIATVGCTKPTGEGVLVASTGLPMQVRLSSDTALQMGTARFAWNYFIGGRLVVSSSMVALRPRWYPGLAESIEVSEAGRLYTVRLSPDARFASGAPVRAEDVVASISPVAPPYLPEGYLDARVVDERTVALRLAHPQASFMLHLGWIRVGRADQMPRAGQPWDLPLADVDSAGPFRVVAVREGELVLARNPAGLPRPRLEGVIVRASTPWESFSQLLDGSADYVLDAPDSIGAEHLVGVPHVRQVHEDEFVVGLVMNCADDRLADRRVRKALNLAVDRRAFIERNMRDAAIPAGGYVDGEGRYDPLEAVRLLEEAGWRVGEGGIREKDGRRLELEVLVPSPRGTGLVALPGLLRADLAEIGVELDSVVVDHGEMKRRAIEGRFQLMSWWHHLGLMVLDHYREPGQGFNRWGDYGHCRDAEMTAAMQEADTATDEDARTAGALHFHRAASDAYPMLFAYRPGSSELIHRRLRGEPAGTAFYGAIHLLRVLPEERLPRDDLREWLP